jgi:hypothetical protein
MEPEFSIRKSDSWSLSWTQLMKSTLPYSDCYRPILKVSSHLYLDLQTGLFPLCSQTISFYSFLVFPVRATSATQPILIDLMTKMVSPASPSVVLFLKSKYSPRLFLLEHPQSTVLPTDGHWTWNHLPCSARSILSRLSAQFIETILKLEKLVDEGYLCGNTTSFGHMLRVEPISVSLALLSVLGRLLQVKRYLQIKCENKVEGGGKSKL